MRDALQSDIPYFVEAGRQFVQFTPFSFDAESYAEALERIIDAETTVSSVIEGKGHCAATLGPSMFDSRELIARVFTTWGRGGLRCFIDVERKAKKRGAKFIVADSYVEPRIIKFYERRGMFLTDSVYLKAL